jgi:AraC-like DNA-binding protein
MKSSSGIPGDKWVPIFSLLRIRLSKAVNEVYLKITKNRQIPHNTKSLSEIADEPEFMDKSYLIRIFRKYKKSVSA